MFSMSSFAIRHHILPSVQSMSCISIKSSAPSLTCRLLFQPFLDLTCMSAAQPSGVCVDSMQSVWPEISSSRGSHLPMLTYPFFYPFKFS